MPHKHRDSHSHKHREHREHRESTKSSRIEADLTLLTTDIPSDYGRASWGKQYFSNPAW